MIDPNEHEGAALRHAGQLGGEYVESLGKTDLSAWSEKEWAMLIDVVVTAFQDKLREAYAQMPVPF